jgi:hypothetical protein
MEFTEDDLKESLVCDLQRSQIYKHFMGLEN